MPRLANRGWSGARWIARPNEKLARAPRLDGSLGPPVAQTSPLGFWQARLREAPRARSGRGAKRAWLRDSALAASGCVGGPGGQ
eukprot:6575321-Alexandrium_andersonii.AAC.1